MFVSFDGIDGGGKSTQIRLLAEWMRDEGHVVDVYRDPGSTQLGESIREILLHREDVPLSSTSEMLLYMAARAQLVHEQIRPSLDRGAIVISDRFLLANVVYQGWGGGLDVDSLWRVGQVATQGLRPDITFVLDLSVELSMARVGGEQDRLEKRGSDYFNRVRQGFLKELPKASPKGIVLDASQDVESIQNQIQQYIREAIL